MRQPCLIGCLAAFCWIAPATGQALRFAEGSRGVEVRFQTLENGRGGALVLVPLRSEGRDHHFVLDSGASGHALSQRLVRELGLEAQSRTRVRGVGRRDRSEPVYEPPPMSLGRARVELGAAVALDLAEFGRPFGVRVDGVLGVPLFAGHVVRIDYPGRILRIETRKGYALPEQALRVGLELVHGIPVVRARLDGRAAVPLKVDTGSTLGLVLYPDFVGEHALLRGARDDYERARLLGIGGELEARLGRLRELRVGALRIENAMTWMLEPRQRGGGLTRMPGFDGNLGSGVLRAFVVSFDLDGRQLLFEGEKRRHRFEPDLGFEVALRRGRVRVQTVAPGSAADEAGLRVGDRLTRVDDSPVRAGPSRLAERILSVAELRLAVDRDGNSVELVLRRRPYLSALRSPEDLVPDTGSGRN